MRKVTEQGAVWVAVWTLGAGMAMGAGYVQNNLVASDPGTPAVTHDAQLVNAWGISMGPTTPFWVSDNGTGLTTLYNGAGTKQALVVTIPPPGGSGPGAPAATPTGQVFNGTTTDFIVGAVGARFIFATEDGTISGWNSGTVATLKVDNSAGGAVYKGLAIGNNGAQNQLYAANFHAGTIDVVGPTWAAVTPSGNFVAPNLPAGFAPFNVQNLGGHLFVTYAMQDAAKHDDVAGPGLGMVAEFDMNGNYMRTLASGGALNSPWGLAMAPANFGELSGDLLVGNFGDGRINAYDPTTGNFLGQMMDKSGNPVTIDGLWGLTFGTGAANSGPTNELFFSAGPSGESQGLFGTLSVPEPASMGLFSLAGLLLAGKRRRG